jgi:hypothetical protein
MGEDKIVHEWEALTKKLVSDGYDAQIMQEYITMLPKPRMQKPREIPRLEE